MTSVKRIEMVTDYVCRPETTVLEVMARLNAVSPYQFQIVVDGDGRIIGSVTDGDVRRAILRGVATDAPVTECAQSHPVVGRVGEEDGNGEKLAEATMLTTHNPFLPVLDEYGALAEILYLEPRHARNYAALVMAGGFGTRLGDETRYTPKPLLPVGGTPILDHVLARLEAADINEVFVAVHYRAAQIESYLAGRDNRANVHLIHESQPLGTAGALARLPEAVSGPVVVINADLLTQVDMSSFLDFHERHEYDATVAVARYEHAIPFGVVRHSEDGLFQGIDEKPCLRYFVAAGIYVLSPEFRPLAAARHPVDMPELLNAGREVGLKIGLFPIHEFWTDIGDPDDLAVARSFEKDAKTG